MGNPVPAPVNPPPEENEDDLYYWGKKSRLITVFTPEQLSEFVNDRYTDREVRAELIVGLFGTYVRPGFTSADMREVIVDPSWLLECTLERVGGIAGRAPPGHKSGHTSFILRLFHDETLNTEWFIVLNVKGDADVEAMANFIEGKKSGTEKIRLAEFSLQYPRHVTLPAEAVRITERFTKDGVGLMVE